MYGKSIITYIISIIPPEKKFNEVYSFTGPWERFTECFLNSGRKASILPGVLSNSQFRKFRPQIHSKCCSTIAMTGETSF